MRITVFSAKPHDLRFLAAANRMHDHELVFLEAALDASTATLSAGSQAVCVFVNDLVDADAIAELSRVGIRIIALRCAGHDRVDLPAARAAGLAVVRVPAYSPHSVAEHAIGLMLMLGRKLHRAYNRVREGNFALSGLLGSEMHGKTVGLIGTGRIGAAAARILHGFGCEVIAHDPVVDEALAARGVAYVDLPTLLARSAIISLHLPLTADSRGIISTAAVAAMQPGAMLINTSRGGLIDTRAVIDGLKSGRIGALGLDVYERESELFFEDRSGSILQDDLFSRLQTFPNVVITGHQAFFTHEALSEIAATTLGNVTDLAAGRPCANAL